MSSPSDFKQWKTKMGFRGGGEGWRGDSPERCSLKGNNDVHTVCSMFCLLLFQMGLERFISPAENPSSINYNAIATMHFNLKPEVLYA